MYFLSEGYQEIVTRAILKYGVSVVFGWIRTDDRALLHKLPLVQIK